MKNVKFFNLHGVGCLILTSVIVFLAGSFIFWGRVFYRVERGIPGSIVNEFAFALMQNDERMAKSLVSSDQWPQINKWMDEHEAVECDFEWGADNNTFGSGSLQAESGNYVYNLVLNCPSHDNGYYHLVISNIVLQQIGKEWIITGWETCETWEFDFRKECTID